MTNKAPYRPPAQRSPRGRTRSRLAVAFGIGALLFSIALSIGSAAAQTTPRVLMADVDGAITPVMAAHVHDAISRAEREGYEALILNLDTPGGLDSSMRGIVKDILDAKVPVVVHVSPAGARAASTSIARMECMCGLLWA